MKSESLTLLSIALALALSLPADAQVRPGGLFRNRYKKENAELRSRIDSLRKEVDDLRKESVMKDSVLNEMISIYEENESKSAAGLNPEDYSPELTDSLLSIWYLHRQVNEDDVDEAYDMDSVYFASNVSDEVLKTRLESMNSYITLPYNEKVRNYMVLYSEKMPTKMGNILGLCQYYMPIFEETFSKYNLPDELKYVAIIESALNPVAVSRAGAKGMWQFMTKTAKSYGLEINSYVDERFDPFKASDAAARYLVDSYKLFGDWNLAISSYNCGPGNVNKAIRRGGGRDFWTVYDYLPRETRGYVPAFVGAMYAIRFSKEYGLTPSNVQMPVQVDTFEIKRNLHFQQVSDLVGISVEELENLNPQYIKDIVPGNSKPYILRIPYNYTSAFIANEDSLYTHRAEELFNPQTLVNTKSTASASTGGNRVAYKVKSGDSLGKIAARNRVTVNQLKSWNHLKSNTIRVGQTLYIYKAGAPSSSSSAASAATAKPQSGTASSAAATTPSGQATTYKVQKGDSLYKIAQRYGTTADKLMRYNGIGSSLKIGQIIKIPPK
ncbi:MAG: LysM peptidoglycan-binding domain-containing protein [Bacteroidales bacterium]|nr:LysM peptidoglycan-binding domain-containing protein [Bacteroidales bacterium]